MAREAVIVEAVRTAIGKRNGSLAQAHAADLSGQLLRELATRTGIDPGAVDDVIWGCVGQGAILMTRLINHMRDRGIRYGLQTMCEGGGTANATLVELA